MLLIRTISSIDKQNSFLSNRNGSKLNSSRIVNRDFQNENTLSLEATAYNINRHNSLNLSSNVTSRIKWKPSSDINVINSFRSTLDMTKFLKSRVDDTYKKNMLTMEKENQTIKSIKTQTPEDIIPVFEPRLKAKKIIRKTV